MSIKLDRPIVVSFGGGVDSTAMLVEMHRRGVVPHLILFADTGDEEPHTYKHVEIVSQWCVENGFPAIEILKYKTKHGHELTLYEDCWNRKALPSLAYGFKTCTHKFKIGPQQKRCKNDPLIIANGGKYIDAIGLDYGETHRTRMTFSPDHKIEYWYPLDDYRIARKECVSIICAAGLPQPGKSACARCPATKPIEILRMAIDYPEMLQEALDLEARAETFVTIKGLGRNFAWADLFHDGDITKPKQLEMFDIGLSDWQVPCECFNG